MNSEEEINQNIINRGYILPKTRVHYPSFYKLNDGTIIRVIIILNYLLPLPSKHDEYDVNTTNIVSSFTSMEKRRPNSFIPFSIEELKAGIIDEDVEFEVLRENFSVYDLSNGIILSIKPVLGQVKKTKFYSLQGEPIYITNVSPYSQI